MNFADYAPPPPRMATPVMVRVSEADRKQLQALAKRYKIPMSRIAYLAVRHLLDEEFGMDGAQ